MRGARGRDEVECRVVLNGLTKNIGFFSFLFFFFNDTATTEIYTLSLHDALPIYRLHKKMNADLKALMKAKVLPINFTKGHFQQDPPPFAPYVFRDVATNPFVTQVTTAVLGEEIGRAHV